MEAALAKRVFSLQCGMSGPVPDYHKHLAWMWNRIQAQLEIVDLKSLYPPEAHGTDAIDGNQ